MVCIKHIKNTIRLWFVIKLTKKTKVSIKNIPFERDDVISTVLLMGGRESKLLIHTQGDSKHWKNKTVINSITKGARAK